jgi:hypothetical protein
MIPRRIFWLLDLIVIAFAFLAGYQLVPHVLPLFAPGGSPAFIFAQRGPFPQCLDGSIHSPLRRFTGAIESTILPSESSWNWYIGHYQGIHGSV